MTGQLKDQLNHKEHNKQRMRALKAIASGKRKLTRMSDAIVLVGGSSASSRISIALPVWNEIVCNDFVCRCEDNRVVLTDTGMAALRRALSEGDPFGDQHRERAGRMIELPDGSRQCVSVNESESPLAWLRRRKGPNGRRFLNDAQFAAGERIRVDFTKGNMLPRITANWSATIDQGRRRSGERGGALELTDAAVAARQRVNRALDAVGPELSGVLIDVCCFLKGIEQVEKQHAWPARSGKIVLALALSRLDRHYSGEKTSPAKRRQVLHWGAEDFRPSIDSDVTALQGGGNTVTR